MNRFPVFASRRAKIFSCRSDAADLICVKSPNASKGYQFTAIAERENFMARKRIWFRSIVSAKNLSQCHVDSTRFTADRDAKLASSRAGNDAPEIGMNGR